MEVSVFATLAYFGADSIQNADGCFFGESKLMSSMESAVFREEVNSVSGCFFSRSHCSGFTAQNRYALLANTDTAVRPIKTGTAINRSDIMKLGLFCCSFAEAVVALRVLLL